MPSANLPDAICIPSRFVYQSNLEDSDVNQVVSIKPSGESSKCIDDLVSFYCNAIEYLSNYVLTYCSKIDSISKIISISSTTFYNPSSSNTNSSNINSIISSSSSNQLFVNASFDMITLSNRFDTRRISPITIVETSLYKTLLTTSSYYIKSKTGFLSFYQKDGIQSLILAMESEQKTRLPLAGM